MIADYIEYVEFGDNAHFFLFWTRDTPVAETDPSDQSYHKLSF